ncbi:DUF1036 domain-containing protein [Nereida sp. MMG025]|uniref:DUF1036 domain-containing protein n=1 Tax=Nereida sp. MMG025 TaxID=2909981 RepID=UPI00351D0698|nr:DUF1036 domain-containing protein [Nereida sp. MMG025]
MRLIEKPTSFSGGELWRKPSIVAFALVSWMNAAPAYANFQFCNQTLDVANVAIGTYKGTDWETSGWWTVGPNQCANVIQDILPSRYIYVFARDVFNRPLLEGTTGMCIDPDEFRILGRGDCLLRGHLAAQFFEVDTRRSERWTFFLRAPVE